MKSDGTTRIPTFKPYNQTDTAFRQEVAQLNSQGRAVLLALGGADAHIQLVKGDEQALRMKSFVKWKHTALMV